MVEYSFDNCSRLIRMTWPKFTSSGRGIAKDYLMAEVGMAPYPNSGS